MKTILVLGALLGSSIISHAQTAAASAASTKADAPAFLAQLPAAIQQKEQAFSNSRAQFAKRSFAAAEAALLAGNVAGRDTPQWHCESGASLMRMAFSFREDSDADTASTIAQRALAHLQQADKNYAANVDPAEIANENELMAFLYEHLLGDRAAAKLCYQKAVRLSPKTGHAAELLAAIERTEAEELSKKNYIPGR